MAPIITTITTITTITIIITNGAFAGQTSGVLGLWRVEFEG